MKKSMAFAGILLLTLLAIWAFGGTVALAAINTPQNLVATPGNQSISLTWDPPEEGGDFYDQYFISFISQNLVMGTAYTTDTAITLTATGISGAGDPLINGQYYNVSLHARNSSTGALSVSATARITPNLLPGPVQNLSVTPTLSADGTTGKIDVSWNAPANVGDFAALARTVYYKVKLSTDENWTDKMGAGAHSFTNLPLNTAYTVQVRAYLYSIMPPSMGPVAGSDGPVTSDTVTTPMVLPANVRYLMATSSLSADGASAEINVTWSAPTNAGNLTAMGYEVFYEHKLSTDADTDWVSVADSTSATYRNKALGTAYTVQVRPYLQGDDGRVEGSEGLVADFEITTAYGAIGPVSNLTATPTATTIDVSWGVPDNVGGHDASTFRYQFNLSTSDQWVTLSDLTREVTGCTPGTEYTVQVRAYAGNGVYGEIASRTIRTLYDAIGPVQNLTASPADGALDVSWMAPAPTGGYTETVQYEIKLDTDINWTDVGTDTSITLNNLTNGTAYTVQVRPYVVSGGLSIYGTDIAEVTETPAAGQTAPGEPEIYSTDAGDGTITVSWTEPASDGGSAITEYEIMIDPPGTGWVSTGLIREYTFDNLTNGQMYTLYVRAVNSVGPGDAADTMAQPTGSAPAAPGLSGQANDGFVTLTWDEPDGAPTGYRIYRDGSLIAGITSGTAYMDENVVNDATYSYHVIAYNIFGDSVPSNVVELMPSADPILVPGAPVLSGSAGSATVSLAWTMPAGAPSGYRVYRDGDLLTDIADETTLEYTDSNVVNGTTYTYYVVAYNVGGDGPDSNTLDLEPTSDPIPVPGAPVLSGSAGNATVSLAWTMPAGAPSGYRVYRDGDLLTDIADETTLEYTDSNVVNGTTYTYHVVAYNVGGAGPYSNLLDLMPSSDAVPLPGAPVLSGSAGDATVSLVWTMPAGAATGYRVYRDGSPLVDLSGVTTLGYTDNSVVNDISYRYYVIAYNDSGDGPASNHLDLMPSADPIPVPGAPVLSGSAGDGYAQLSWVAQGTDADGFLLFRDGAQLVDIPMGSATAYKDETVVNDVAYTYQVAGYNDSGTGAMSNTVTLTPQSTSTGGRGTVTLVDNRNKESEPQRVRIVRVKEYCNVRSGPGEQYDIVGKAYLDEEVELIEWDETDTWCKVYYNNRQSVGWIHGKFLGR